MTRSHQRIFDTCLIGVLILVFAILGCQLLFPPWPNAYKPAHLQLSETHRYDVAVNQEFMKIESGGLSVTAREIQIEALLNNDQLTTPTLAKIDKELGSLFLSSRGEVVPELVEKSVKYNRLAMQYAWSLKDELWLYIHLSDGMQRLARQTTYPEDASYSREWPQKRGEIAKVLWRGLKVARDAGLPDVAPPELPVPAELTVFGFDGRIMAVLSHDPQKRAAELKKRAADQKLQAQKAAERNRLWQAIEDRRTLRDTVQLRDSLEHSLYQLYLQRPLALDELETLGNSIFKDKAYVASMVSDVQSEYIARFRIQANTQPRVSSPMRNPTAMPDGRAVAQSGASGFTQAGDHYFSSLSFDRDPAANYQLAERSYQQALALTTNSLEKIILSQKLAMSEISVAMQRRTVTKEEADANLLSYRANVAKVIWEGLRVAKEINLPVQSSLDANDPIATAIKNRQTMEANLIRMYTYSPKDIDELSTMGHSMLQDKPYVDSIVARANTEYLALEQRYGYSNSARPKNSGGKSMNKKIVITLLGWFVLLCSSAESRAYQIVQPTPQLTVEQRLKIITQQRAPERPSADEHFRQLEALLDDNPSTPTRTRIIGMLGSNYHATGISLDGVAKAMNYLILDLKTSHTLTEKLILYNHLADAKSRLARRPHGINPTIGLVEWSEDRRAIAQILWEGLRTAQAANLPAQMPPEPEIPASLSTRNSTRSGSMNGIRIPAAQVDTIDSATRQKMWDAIEAQRTAIYAVRIRQFLEDQLAGLYVSEPLALDELASMGDASISDKAYVDTIVQWAKTRYEQRFQTETDSRAQHIPPVYPKYTPLGSRPNTQKVVTQ